MSPKEKIWNLEPHTKGKHEVLRRYLEAWFAILGSRPGRIAFFDGFAGPGEYKDGEEGSPLIALRVLQEHRAKLKAETRFWFIEKDPARAAHLEELIEARKPSLPKNCHVTVVTGGFDATMTKVFDAIDARGRKLAPAFVMVDPFGVSGTPMRVISRILRGDKGEVYISFMYESISRFKATPEFEAHLTSLFGTEEWKKGIALKESAKKDFFYELYKRQLRASGARYVLHFDLFEGKRLIYAIFFATRHWMGADRMKAAIWKVAPFGDFAFRGTRQLTLGLGPSVDYSPLRKALQAHFKGKGWVSIEKVTEFVGSDQTDFHTGQLKKPALVPMEDEGLIEVDSKTRKRKRSYPAGTRLRFV